MSRETTNFECVLMGIILILLAGIVLLCSGCATESFCYEYDVPAHKLRVCSRDVRAKLYTHPDGRIPNGLCDTDAKIIWCKPTVGNKREPDTQTNWHEEKHLIKEWGRDWHK